MWDFIGNIKIPGSIPGQRSPFSCSMFASREIYLVISNIKIFECKIIRCILIIHGVFLLQFYLQCLVYISKVLWCRVLLMSSRVNKWSLQLNPSVSFLCLCFKFNPTPKLHIDSNVLKCDIFWYPIRDSKSKQKIEELKKWWSMRDCYILLMEHWIELTELYELFTKEWCQMTNCPVGQKTSQKQDRWSSYRTPGQLKSSNRRSRW